MKRLVNLALFLLVASLSIAQTSTPAAVLMPMPRQCFYDNNGNPLSGGTVSTFSAGTSTPLATYTDNTALYQNTNPVNLDSSGCASIWIGPQAYKVILSDSNGAQQWMQDNVSDVGQILYQHAVILDPAGGALQTISGPLGATYFQQTTPKVTSPGVRVALLDPVTVLDTTIKPPTVTTTQPGTAGQNYTIPDPGVPQANFVLSPGTSGNVLDCTQSGLTCKRTAYAYFDGAACNNATAFLSWDTFGTNSPSPLCITGTNIQKGVMALPSAATRIQSGSCTGSAATTCVVAIPSTTVAGDLLEIECVVDGGKTVSGVTDGTNAYTKAISVANGNTDLEIWYFNGNSTSVAATTSLTTTLSAGANSACRFHEYAGIVTSTMLDKTASSTGTGTATASGTTAGTAQAVELVIAAVGTPSNPSIIGQTGWVQHTPVSQSTNVTVNSEGLIQQAITSQSGAFTLGSSQAWASAVATFKVNVASAITAQRSITLPPFYDATHAVNAIVKWQAPQIPIGTANVTLGAALECTVDGNTDDSAFNTAITASPAVPNSTTNTLTSTTLSSLVATGCAAGSQLHLQVERLRYDPSDTYEGWVYLNGVGLQFGINQ